MKNRSIQSNPQANINDVALVLGGAGFIGTNVAHRLLSEGKRVLIFDNLSRVGVENNLKWLQSVHGNLLDIEIGDIRDADSLVKVVRRASSIFDFAAQVAVTTSLVDPILDFEINARGTLNLLELLRQEDIHAPLIYTSTNKVYGHLNGAKLRANGRRYTPVAAQKKGFNESQPLEFRSPYGCSKGAAEQYVLDYARTFNLPCVVFRMSCIYGPHQCGNEDQGWVAHFVSRALKGQPITVYGDGKQVRDILFVDDLVDALLLAQDHMPQIRGNAFNIGGGVDHTVSLLELLDLIAAIAGERPKVRFEQWRQADQRYYVSDTRRFSAATGWSPKFSVVEGVQRLSRWLSESAASYDTQITLAPGNGQERELALTARK